MAGGDNLDARLLRFRSNPESPDAPGLAEALLTAGRADDALSVAGAALQAGGPQGPLLVTAGQAYLHQNELLRAQKALLKAARATPGAKEPYRWLGEVLLKRGDPERAAKVLERARKIDPGDRAVEVLAQRAARLARIAADTGEPRSVPLQAVQADPEADEATVVASDLAARIAGALQAGPDAASPPVAAAPAPPPPQRPTTKQKKLKKATMLGMAAMQPPAAPIPAPPPPRAAPSPPVAAPPPPRAAPSPAIAAPPPPRAAPSPAIAAPPPPAAFAAPSPAASPSPPVVAPSPPSPAAAPPPPGVFAPAPAAAASPPVATPSPAIAAPPPPVAAPAPVVAPSPVAAPAPVAASPVATPPADEIERRRAQIGRAVKAAREAAAEEGFTPEAEEAPTSLMDRSSLKGFGLGSDTQETELSSLDVDLDAPTGINPRPAVASPAAPPDPKPKKKKRRKPTLIGGMVAAPLAPPPTAPPAPAAPPVPAPPAPALAELAPPEPSPPAPAFPEPAIPATSPGELAAPPPPSVPLALPDVLGDAGPPPVRAPDVPLGERAGQPEQVDEVLRMLEQQSLFEPPTGEAVAWVPRKEVPKTGTRVGRTLIVFWVLGVLLAVGGYFGWQEWVKYRHGQAAELVATASEEALGGDHADLVDAERHLRQARDLHPLDTAGPEVLLFVHAQRALEEGAFEPGYLRPAIARARELEIDGAYIEAAEAVLAAAEGDMEAAREAITPVAEAAGEDARLLYLAGRVQQRLGDEAALSHLASSIEKEPKLAAAAIALAEARADEGQAEQALTLIDGVLGRDAEHLRARLWKSFLTTDDVDPDAGLSSLAGIEADMERGAPTDHLMLHLARARLQRRKGETGPAGESVEQAFRAGATEPRLLALVASEARAVGLLTRAQHAATEAVAGAPTNRDFRKLLAEILIERRDGLRAIRALSSLPADDPEVLRLTAHAALLLRAPETLEGVATALSSFLEAQEEPSIEMRALHIRTVIALGRGAEVFEEAQALAREAAGDPTAAKALGEAALAARRGRVAVESLTRLVAAAPDDAHGHFLLGRAQRMVGEGEPALASFRRALELDEGHTDATIALGYLLLDTGAYEDADALYQRLSRLGSSQTALVARLGRVEALVGLGRLDDATVQLEGVREADRETPTYKVVSARLALAKHQPGQAVASLRPLATPEDAGADIVALFGDALYAAEETEAAMAQYERGVGVDEAHPESLLGYAQVLVRAGKSREALNILARASEALDARIRPPGLRGRLHMLIGKSHLLRGRAGVRDARRALRAATEQPGAPAEAFFLLGESLARANTPESRAAYQRYLELEPAGPLADRARRAIQ